jgi:molybdopterin-containing oxidoreductase family iron-sulfur binding subunit
MSSMNESGVRYWKSLDELAQTPEFREAVKREFPDDEWDRLPDATRRGFLKVMGASLAFAGLTGCRWPKEEIVPFAHRPEGWVPGIPQQFATAFERAGVALGVVASSYDGRPVKLEGNPQHPDSRGALPAVAQAAVLELYDPDRGRRLVERAQGGEYVRSWDDFASALTGEVAADGAGFAVLSEASSSPTLASLRGELATSKPRARWYEYEAASHDGEREGLRLAFGRPVRAVLRLAEARVVACFDADPLFSHPAAVGLARDYAESRRPETDMARLYVAEPAFTLTGAQADHRVAVSHGRMAALLAAVARELTERHGFSLPQGPLTDAISAAEENDHGDFVGHLADDLAAQRGHGLVLVGARQPESVHALAAALNEALGAVGTTIDYVEDPHPERPSHQRAIADLAERIGSGEITSLVMLGGNPAFDAPADLGFAALLGKVPFSVHLALYEDETSERCTWHLPRAHSLEAWGDGRAWDGTLTLQQPLIEPLYGGKSAVELVAMLLGRNLGGHDLVRSGAVSAVLPALGFDGAWRKALHDGVVTGTAFETIRPGIDSAGMERAGADLVERLAHPAPAADVPELLLVPDPKIFDGRWANNGWLQELPDAITKVTWDNTLLASPTTARAMGLVDGELAEVTANGATIEVPVYVVPGMAFGSLTLNFGYGRTAAGQVGNGVGVDTYPLRTTTDAWALGSATIRGTGRRHILATTQDHHSIDLIGFEARNLRVAELVREASLDAYIADPEVVHQQAHHPPLISLWREHTYEDEQWGMSIDLNSCIGCNACVVACQAENNIPVVGREQVINQREMHWIRVDRYFKTPAGVAPDQVESADLVFQPMTCVQCEMAPCEQVCPVGATQHTRDGLNAMAYNRCIGTRYCSNNCPFKVRRFNFFNYHKHLADTTKMQYNPEVTVRSRGVMEKCSYCVQRIQAVRIPARNDQRPIRDGEITPACAQTCPTRAIVFGNLNDPASEVARLHEDHRSYATLAELNIKPRTTYMARISNPAFGDSADTHGAAGASTHGEGHGKESA